MALVFTFSKMAAGMYLEHYLDSTLFILFPQHVAEILMHTLQSVT